MQITIRADNAAAVMLTYSRRAEILRDLRPLWRDLEDVYHREEMLLFMSQGASAGVRWKPLNKRYARYKAKRWGNRVLIRRGELYRSLITGAALLSTPGGVTFGPGPDLYYALFLNKRRRLQPATAASARNYNRAAASWLAKKMSTGTGGKN